MQRFVEVVDFVIFFFFLNPASRVFHSNVTSTDKVTSSIYRWGKKNKTKKHRPMEQYTKSLKTKLCCILLL